LLFELVPKYLDPTAYRVALSRVPEITKILELKWAHIYTGNARIARAISDAAAKRLTPMTLELGGMGPIIIATASIWVRRRCVWQRERLCGGRLIMVIVGRCVRGFAFVLLCALLAGCSRVPFVLLVGSVLVLFSLSFSFSFAVSLGAALCGMAIRCGGWRRDAGCDLG
ncbi:hypothetical protein DFP72DRAFT_811897, partial [Ephemerocybe angulata]